MDKSPDKIGFSLTNVSSEQFALIEEAYCESEEISINANLRFGIDQESKMIAVFAAFKFECKNTAFLIVEGGCHFKVQEDAWVEMFDPERLEVNVPKGFLQHLSVITVGTTRGILHAKTENTDFNKFYLPTINVADMVKEDMVFSLNSLNDE